MDSFFTNGNLASMYKEFEIQLNKTIKLNAFMISEFTAYIWWTMVNNLPSYKAQTSKNLRFLTSHQFEPKLIYSSVINCGSQKVEIHSNFATIQRYSPT